jgi:hypothetical protein
LILVEWQFGGSYLLSAGEWLYSHGLLHAGTAFFLVAANAGSLMILSFNNNTRPTAEQQFHHRPFKKRKAANHRRHRTRS